MHFVLDRNLNLLTGITADKSCWRFVSEDTGAYQTHRGDGNSKMEKSKSVAPLREKSKSGAPLRGPKTTPRLLGARGPRARFHGLYASPKMRTDFLPFLMFLLLHLRSCVCSR